MGLCLWILIAPSAWGICKSDLQKQVEAIAQSDSLKSARVGVFVSRLDAVNEPIVNVDGEKYFTPASNLKLFTTAVALELLGANYQIRTSLWMDSREDLWIKGAGDPSFNENSLKSLVKSLVNSLTRSLIKSLKDGNTDIRKNTFEIKTISELKGSGLGAGWQWQDLQEYYGAIADAFIINENVLDWTITPTKINQSVKFSWDRPDLVRGWEVDNRAITGTQDLVSSLMVERSLTAKKLTITGVLPLNSPPELGATAIPDPEMHFLQLLRSELIRQGIQLKEVKKAENRPEALTTESPIIEVAFVLSPTLAELIKATNKDSNNIYAEALLRRIGLHSKISESNSDDRGISLVLEFLKSKGISEISIKDGSGLSTLNLVTPRAIAQLLVLMAGNKVFRDSLAIAGIDGTLKNRFKSTIAQKIVQNNLTAKTGSLSGVNALSGYIKPPKYSELAFSIIVNNSTLSSVEIIKHIDAIALLLTKVEACD